MANALTTEQVEGLRWLVETCGGRVTMYPVVPMYPVMEGLFEAGLVGRELPQFPEERTLFEALDPTCKTVLATLEEQARHCTEAARSDLERLARSVGVFDVAASVDVEGGGGVDWLAVRPRIETDDEVFEKVTVEATSFADALQLLANVTRSEVDRG